jgi:hypothetical protein
MLFEKFQNNPFASTAQCEKAENNHFETSLIPGREIAAAAAVSNVILPGGKKRSHNSLLQRALILIVLQIHVHLDQANTSSSAVSVASSHAAQPTQW